VSSETTVPVSPPTPSDPPLRPTALVGVAGSSRLNAIPSAPLLGVRVRPSGKPDAGAPCRPGRGHICRRIADEDRVGNRDPRVGGTPQEQAGQRLPAAAGTGLVRADVHRVNPGTVLGEQLGEAAVHRGGIVHGAQPARHAPLVGDHQHRQTGIV